MLRLLVILLLIITVGCKNCGKDNCDCPPSSAVALRIDKTIPLESLNLWMYRFYRDSTKILDSFPLVPYDCKRCPEEYYLADLVNYGQPNQYTIVIKDRTNGILDTINKISYGRTRQSAECKPCFISFSKDIISCEIATDYVFTINKKPVSGIEVNQKAFTGVQPDYIIRRK